jgi:hypothetical protein
MQTQKLTCVAPLHRLCSGSRYKTNHLPFTMSFSDVWMPEISTHQSNSTMMAFDNRNQGQEKRTLENVSLSYSLDSILVSAVCQLPGINSDAQQMSCECVSCPTITQASNKLVSFHSVAVPPFLAQIRCQVCPRSSSWTICVDCASSTTKFTTPTQIANHIRYGHKEYYEDNLRQRKRRKANPSSQISLVAESLNHEDPMLVDLAHTCVLEEQHLNGELNAGPNNEVEDEDDVFVPIMDPAPEIGFPPLAHPSLNVASRYEASREFFFRDKTNGNGMKYLAAKAQFGRPDIPPEALDGLEVQMMMQTAELAYSLPKKDRVRLAHYTKTVCEVVKKQTLEELEVASNRQEYRPWTLLPITTPFEMRRQMKDGSKDSMMYTVPHVNVMEVGVHAVSLPSDCIQDLMGHGFPLDFVPNSQEALLLPEFPVRNISSTGMCRQLFDINNLNNPIIADFNVWIFEWSDDFEPNTSLTKSNRGGVWVKTITIGPPGSHSHQLSYTYPIAMGPKNKSHEEAEIIIRDDLLSLARPEGIVIYSKNHGGLIRIRAKLFVCLQDQPERRGENHLTGGSSDLHRRFGYSFPWQDFEDELRPCINCRSILFDKTEQWVCPECEDCTNFAYDLSHPLLQAEHIHEEFGHPGMMELSFEMLGDAVSLAHEEYVAGNWTSVNVHEWLKIFCVKEATAKLVLAHADKCKEYQDAMDDPESSVALKEAVTMEKERNPRLYAPWPHPSVWTRGVDLFQHPDIPMHLLCLGIVKLLLLRVDKWMTKKHKGTPFVRQMKGMLESVQQLNLSWCPILPYKGGKFGGWVSGNYLSMSRLMCWFYSGLDKIVADQEPWTEPERPMKDWTGKDCKRWLRERDLLQTGCAQEVRDRVAAYRQMPLEDQPPVVEQVGGPVEQVEEAIVALDDMMSLLMVEQIDSEEYYVELERTIRVFLTRFADLEEHLAKKNVLPSWLAAFNCLSLLNLPGIVRQYGPIRNIWEGAWVGEGFLRFAKPAVVHGLRKFWERSTMNNLMRMKGMQVLVGEMLTESDDSEDEEHGNPKPEPGLFKCYKSIAEVDDRIRKTNKAISFIVVGGLVGVACFEFGVARFVPVSVGEYQFTKMGRHYFKFERGERGMEGGAYTELVVQQIEEVGILLPHIQLLEYEDAQFIRGSYTLVDRRHRHLDREGKRFTRKSSY